MARRLKAAGLRGNSALGFSMPSKRMASGNQASALSRISASMMPLPPQSAPAVWARRSMKIGSSNAHSPCAYADLDSYPCSRLCSIQTIVIFCRSGRVAPT